jgi:hypothetical protein
MNPSCGTSSAGLTPGAFVAGLVAGVSVLTSGTSRGEHLAALVASNAQMTSLARNHSFDFNASARAALKSPEGEMPRARACSTSAAFVPRKSTQISSLDEGVFTRWLPAREACDTSAPRRLSCTPLSPSSLSCREPEADQNRTRTEPEVSQKRTKSEPKANQKIDVLGPARGPHWIHLGHRAAATARHLPRPLTSLVALRMATRAKPTDGGVKRRVHLQVRTA